MKLGVSSYSFAKYMKATGANYIDICNKAKEIGFDAIDFSAYFPVFHGDLCAVWQLYFGHRLSRLS